jgi:nickel-dependent lactate racemase
MPYGATVAEADLRGAEILGTLDVAEAPALHDVAGATLDGLARPIGMPGAAFDAIQPGQTVCVIVSDSFRYTGMERVLPTLIHALEERGVREEDLSFLYATGTHRGPDEAEQKQILGAGVHHRFAARAHTHDAHDAAQLVELGTTSRGTRVQVNRRALDCDHLIVTGTVVLHYFGGFGGGRKAVVPGVAGVETIAQNHARNLDPVADRLNPAVRIGVLDGNPVAEDMLEASRFCRVTALINTVLNRQGQIAGLFVGDLEAAHRAACDFAKGLYAAPMDRRADLVIASAGNAKNFIQSHKALFNAHQAVRPDGRMVFLCPAGEGYGGNKFRDWVSLGSRSAIIRALRERAEINGQTALSTVEKAAITTFVTEMSADEVGLLGGRKAETLQEAIDLVLADFAAEGIPRPTVRLMPSASYCVPFATGAEGGAT